MSPDVQRLVLDRLQHAQATLERIEQQIDDMNVRAVDIHADVLAMGVLMEQRFSDRRRQLRRLQDMDVQLERIERRLELTDGPSVN